MMIACLHSLSFHLVRGVEVNHDTPEVRIQCKSDALQLCQRKTFMSCVARMRKMESTHRRKYDYDNSFS